MPTGSLVGGSFAGGPFPSAKHRSNIDPMTRGGGKRKSFEGSSRSPAKRRRESVSDDGGYNNDDSDDDEDDDEGDDDADAETTEYKRVGGGVSTEESPTRKDPAKPGPVQPLSCPFRKRNPKRFNFLDHFQCTRAFKSLSLVKAHARSCHRLHECYRCKSRFPPLETLHEHAKQTPLCVFGSPAGRDDEDGIGDNIHDRLLARSRDRKVSNWDELWKTVFPDDTFILSSRYEPFILTETFVDDPAAIPVSETDAALLNKRVHAPSRARRRQGPSPKARGIPAASPTVWIVPSRVPRPTPLAVGPVVQSWQANFASTSSVRGRGLCENGRQNGLENGPLSFHPFGQLAEEPPQQVSPQLSVYNRLGNPLLSFSHPLWLPGSNTWPLHFSEIDGQGSSHDLQSRSEELPVSTSSRRESHGGQVEDHTKTASPGATSVSRPDTRQYILELAEKNADSLAFDVDAKELLKSRHAFPELINAFSVKFGLNEDPHMDRDVMYFVYKYQRDIALQLESILTCRDAEATVSTKRHELDKMSLSQKMNLWDRQAPTNDVKDVAEDDENVDLGGISKFRSVLSTNRAVSWLAERLRNRSVLQWESSDAEDLEVHRVRQTILAALTTSIISKREPPR